MNRDTPGHKYRYSKEDVWNNFLMSSGGFKKRSLYAWMDSRGNLLCTPHHDYDCLAQLKDKMQEMTVSDGHIRLVELRYDQTKIRLDPPPDPEEKHHMRGGHAIGGSGPPRTLSDILNEFKRISEQQYANKPLLYPDNELHFYLQDDCACMEHGNVRCWVRHVPKEERNKDVESNLYLQWSAHVTMIKNWNENFHDVCLGEFYSGSDAVNEAFMYFIRFQMCERYLDDV
jgi:hypothetical protein